MEKILSVKNLKKYYESESGFFNRKTNYIKAVDGISFDIFKGETFGLVGESGCGKTTIGQTIVRLLEVTEGNIDFKIEDTVYNLAKMNDRELRPLRKYMQMIFQDPYSSLSPRMTVRDIIGEPLVLSNIAKGKELDNMVKELLAEVGLKKRYVNRYPHAFSGGQRQRLGIARSLISRPEFIVADEPTSALDVSVQAQILELLIKLKNEFGLSYLFISHDLSVIKYICDRVGVMYLGKLVELAETDKLFTRPLHPYTAALLSAIPKVDPTLRGDKEILKGEVPDPSSPPSGCYFHPRCKYAKDICYREEPEFRDLADGNESHQVACHFADELSLESAI